MKIKNYRSILIDAYKNFNNRNIDDIIPLMCEDVLWPNGLEGGCEKGHAGVRDYWMRQWKSINPTVEPLVTKDLSNNKYEVVVHQVVRDMTGKLLSDNIVKHIYQFEDGLIKRMQIDKIYPG